MLKRLLLSAFICYGATAMAQTGNNAAKLTGKALDANTGKPVEYASVVLLHPQDSSVVTGMYTEPDGDFAFNAVPTGNYVLRITFMGYEKLLKAIKIIPGKPIQSAGIVKLQPAGKVLATVEIKSEKPAFSMQIDRQVFDAGSIVTAEGGTGTDVLKNIPSVNVDIDDNLTLRGKSVTIYVDGKPSPFGDAKTALQMIPASTIDRVEVINNPSAKFEANGGGGIINIILKKDKAIGYNVMVSAGVATRGQLNGNLNTNLRIRKFNFFANFNGWHNSQTGYGYSNRQNLIPDTAGTAFFTQDSRNKNSNSGRGGRIGLDYYLNDYNTITISEGLSVNSGNSTDDIMLNYLDAHKSPLQTGERHNNSGYRNPNNNTSLNFRHTTDKQNEEWTAYISYSNNKGRNNSNYNTLSQYADNTQGPSQQQRNLGVSQNQFWNIQTDYTTPVGKKGKFEAGAKVTLQDNNNDYDAQLFNFTTQQFEKSLDLSNTYFYKQDIYGGYMNFSSAIGNLGYQVGARVEQANLKGYSYTKDTSVNNKFLNVFPSVFLKYNLPHNENQSLILNYSTRIDRPGFDQLLPYVNNSDPQNIRVGNPELNPSLTHKFEANYSRYFPNTKDYLNTGVYYSQANDDIDRISLLDTTTGVTTTKPMNLATDKDWGANFTYNLHVIQGWNVTTNLNAEYSKLTGANINNEYLTYGITVNSNVRLPGKINVQVNGYYRSPRVQPQGTFKAMNGMDLGIRKEMLKNNALAIALNISDVLNTQNYSSHYETDAFIQDYVRKRTTRFIRLNIRYRFGKMDPEMFKKKKKQEVPEDESDYKERDKDKKPADSTL
ncbi:TonB-dependent receptor domain-containing protein [Chitinophaga sp. S165]|uniref:TonB-dependent receptor domain-containing protein n=1 Tax=Chitinophaga sp. S165 TaxID=2135462 RepID=UPI000D716026|nr:TonB-dependent receptor [Chitinophaga sp. S165]PWV45349.1 outer membrane receptor protein involved in Fe transport [Chitinophaga sp. S165]